MRVMVGTAFAGLVTLGAVGLGGAGARAADRTNVAPETSAVETAPPGSAASWPPPQEQLDAALLTITDMPTGWATVTDDDSDDSGPPCDDAGLAKVLEMDSDDLPDGQFTAAADEDFGPLLGNAVTVLPPEAPDDVMTTWRDRVLACENESDGFDISFGELSFPTMGDESFAVRMNLTNDTATAHVDMLMVRTGDIVVALQTYDQFGDSTELLTEYAQPAVDRATSALS